MTCVNEATLSKIHDNRNVHVNLNKLPNFM